MGGAREACDRIVKQQESSYFSPMQNSTTCVYYRDDGGRTPLHWAAVAGLSTAVPALVASGTQALQRRTLAMAMEAEAEAEAATATAAAAAAAGDEARATVAAALAAAAIAAAKELRQLPTLAEEQVQQQLLRRGKRFSPG